MLALVCALGLGARCGDEEKPGASASTSTTPPGLRGKLTVLAAASLSEAFKELGRAFEGRRLLDV